MATYYVSPTGNNSNAGTSGSPWKTFAKANTVAGVGDTVRALTSGTFAEMVTVKSGVTYKTTSGAKIDAEKTRNYAFLAKSVNGFRIEGFECLNGAVAGITASECYNFAIVGNTVHDHVGNGISVEKSDLVTIDGNTVYNSANTGAQSGISVLMARDYAGTTPADGFRTRVINNICRNNVTSSGSKSDGNGIIIDKFHYNATKYTGKTLVEGNLCYGNGGAGIRIMASTDCTVRLNTCYNNMQDLRKTDTWMAELHSQWSYGNVWAYNIGVATRKVTVGTTVTKAYGFQNNYSDPYNGGTFGPQGGNTYTGNILIGIGAAAGQNVNGTSGAQLPTSPANKIGVDPLLTNPGAADFSLQAGSPAIGAAAGGKNIGYYQSGGAPTPDVTIATAPVITGSNTASGQSFSVTAGTYNGTATVASPRIAQLLVNGTWTDLDASATSSLTVYPSVTVDTPLRVIEKFTGQGVADGTNPSAQVIVTPATVDTAALAVRVGALEVSSNGLTTQVASNNSRLSDVEAVTSDLATTVPGLDSRMSDTETAMLAMQMRLAALELGGAIGGGGIAVASRRINIVDLIGPVTDATPAQRKALRDALDLREIQFVGRLANAGAIVDYGAALTGGIGGTIQPGDLLLQFGLRTNATLPSPSPAPGWASMFPDYSNAAPWQVIGWHRRADGTETDPMPSAHTRLLLVYRNAALGAVSTPLTGNSTTAAVPAISVGNGDWAAGFVATRLAQADMDSALTAAGLTTRRKLANGSDTNSHAYADSNGGSNGFTQRNQAVSSSLWFGVSFGLTAI